MAAPSLAGLPVELVQEIQSLLQYASSVALRLTCRALYLKTKDPNSKSTYDISDLAKIELWPRYNDAAQRPNDFKQPLAGLDFFACSQCLRIRSAIHFSNAMMRGKRGKMSSFKDKNGRLCISCGIVKGVYRKNVSFQFGGYPLAGIAQHTGGVCQYCEQFHSVHDKCMKC